MALWWLGETESSHPAPGAARGVLPMPVLPDELSDAYERVTIIERDELAVG
jgi:hypothetical protein